MVPFQTAVAFAPRRNFVAQGAMREKYFLTNFWRALSVPTHLRARLRAATAPSCEVREHPLADAQLSFSPSCEFALSLRFC